MGRIWLIAFFLAQGLGDRWVVVGVVGKWHALSDPTPFHLGQSVEPGTAFVREPPNARSGSITFAWDKDTRETHACENAGDCEKLFKVPAAPKSSGVVGWFRETLAEWSREPKRYVAAVSRDVGGLHDAVAKAGDLAPVFTGTVKGTYRLKIDPAPAGGNPVTVAWDPARAGSAVVPGLSPGLYRIQPAEEQGGDAWVLVRTPRDFEKANAAFREVVAQTEAWREDVGPAGIRAIHRARLEMLAR